MQGTWQHSNIDRCAAHPVIDDAIKPFRANATNTSTLKTTITGGIVHARYRPTDMNRAVMTTCFQISSSFRRAFIVSSHAALDIPCISVLQLRLLLNINQHLVSNDTTAAATIQPLQPPHFVLYQPSLRMRRLSRSLRGSQFSSSWFHRGSKYMDRSPELSFASAKSTAALSSMDFSCVYTTFIMTSRKSGVRATLRSARPEYEDRKEVVMCMRCQAAFPPGRWDLAAANTFCLLNFNFETIHKTSCRPQRTRRQPSSPSTHYLI